MKILMMILFLCGLLTAIPGTANAASCAAKANAVASRNDARVLAVSAVNQGGKAMCRITVLIKSNNGGPARKKTVVVRK